MALSMTPGQLEVYRAARRRREAEEAEHRRVRAKAALTLAREAAGLLRAEFGVGEVYLFGSLAEADAFGLRSDIDLAAAGLGAGHYRALGRLLSLSPDLEFDLVDLDTCDGALREAIVARGVAL